MQDSFFSLGSRVMGRDSSLEIPFPESRILGTPVFLESFGPVPSYDVPTIKVSAGRLPGVTTNTQ